MNIISPLFLNECEQYINQNKVPKPAIRRPRVKSRMAEFIPEEAVEYMNRNRVTHFTEQLFSYIDRVGCKDSQIYKKAYIDRRLFSKIRSNKLYIPAKKTIIALCLALELDRQEADALLSSAGYSLSKSSEFDLIIGYCINKKVYKLMEVNEVLEHFGQEVF